MASFSRPAVLTGVGISLFAVQAQSADAGRDDGIAPITGALLQADGPAALRLLSDLPTDRLNDKDRAFRTCATTRLRSDPPVGMVSSPVTGRQDRLAKVVLLTYHGYWRRAAMDPPRRDAAEEELRVRLARLLHAAPDAKLDDLERTLARRLARSGFHSLEGRTGFLRELMIWRRQVSRFYAVALPEGSNRTRVVFLDRFVSMGWSSYLTCERTGTGGWTKPDGLYVVAPSYSSFTDENFRVNFLAHESQHYLDHRQFPALQAWELEFRAKLVELAFAQATMDKLIVRLGSDQGDDPGSPHSYANKRVLAAVGTRLGLEPDADLAAQPVSSINQAARSELLEDSRRRRSATAKGST